MAGSVAHRFLVKGSGWQPLVLEKAYFYHGYVDRDVRTAITLRIKGDGEAKLVLNTSGGAIEAAEFECDISIADATELLKRCKGAVVEKIRHWVIDDGQRWTVDVYVKIQKKKPSRPLVIAEMGSAQDGTSPKPKPDWIAPAAAASDAYSDLALALNGLPLSEKPP
jgi:CYTH domain-containing protein